ncbi:hypothetical protein IW261DRAFT_1632767 [Armillaria novae-zelandiae]|uniref:Uncharacterized protein n=1 Tax=Armillaria novae-zelandiae TaxID=153914 RepID=A0AA39N886_9AGAR|nr:hypothetical protein IW261DRAFT_1632767 [Armillaria novae-zelandiae]
MTQKDYWASYAAADMCSMVPVKLHGGTNEVGRGHLLESSDSSSVRRLALSQVIYENKGSSGGLCSVRKDFAVIATSALSCSGSKHLVKLTLREGLHTAVFMSALTTFRLTTTYADSHFVLVPTTSAKLHSHVDPTGLVGHIEVSEADAYGLRKVDVSGFWHRGQGQEIGPFTRKEDQHVKQSSHRLAISYIWSTIGHTSRESHEKEYQFKGIIYQLIMAYKIKASGIDDEKNHLAGNKLVYLSQADHRTSFSRSYQKERANIRPATCGHQVPLEFRPAFRELL